MAKVRKANQAGVQRVLRLLLEDTQPPSAPEEGAYWWVPLPATPPAGKKKIKNTTKPGSKPPAVRWVLLPLLASDWENVAWETLHPYRWIEVKAALALIWKKPKLVQELIGCHNGLPRGRVAISVSEDGAGYLVDHGDNHPPGTSMATVAKKFGIVLGGPNRIDQYDPRYHHYDLDLAALAKIERALGVSLGLGRK